MDLDDLFKAIVPLTFLAIWALTSLFNREARPAPVRPGMGPRPGGLPPGPRPLERPGAPPSRDPSARWSAPAGQGAPGARRPASQVDDDILIIRSEATRAAGPPLSRPGGGASSSRRASRAKAVPSAPPKRSEPPAARPLASVTGPSLSQQVEQSIEVAPLTGPSPMPVPPPAAPAKGMPGLDLRRLVGSPEKIREAIILNELLRPPVALRPRRTP